ncbi:MAG: S9 family peptidase [Bacteroidales bacterium]
MTRISLLIPACIIAVLNVVTAQDKMLSIQEATHYGKDLVPGSLKNLQWRGESDYFAYVSGESVVTGKAKSDKRDTIFSLDDINCSLNKIQEDSVQRMPRFKWTGENVCMFTHNHRVFLFEMKLKQLREMNSYDREASNIDIDDNSYAVAYTLGNNLWLAIEGRQVQVTDDQDKNIVNGQTAHRNEFGISKGTFWSPGGNYLAFYRKDERKVTDYPVVDVEKRIAEPAPVKYPMAGMDSEEVTLGVYNIGSGRTIFIETGEPADQYLTCVTWGPQEKYIYVAVLNRDQDHVRLNQYDVRTGAFVKTLFEERNEYYVEPENQLYFLETKPELFLWQSERDGFNHLYLYDTGGELIQQLTRGPWVVKQLLGTGSKDRKVFFTSTMESPLNTDLYVLDIRNGRIRKLLRENGTHRALLNKNGKYLIDIFSDTAVARKYRIIDARGKVLQTLLADEDPLEEYNLGGMEIFTIPSGDGDDLYCRLIKPADLDTAKKYPVIVYVYGGPHAQLVTNSWLGGAGLFLNYLAQQGYVVFTLDNRGSANRGLAFEQAVFRNLGTLEIQDQMKGVEYLKSLPYVDPERIGVDGWSYGGFMTILLMLKEAETFRVGVAGGPVTDWKYYEVMYGERYMDTPEQNPGGYKEASLLTHASKLKGKLLIIHGTSDPVVVWQHSLTLIKKFIEEGIQVDYFIYPGHQHGIGGRDRLHLNQKIFNYFRDHL